MQPLVVKSPVPMSDEEHEALLSLTTEERQYRFAALWEVAVRLGVAKCHVVRDPVLARLPIEEKLQMVDQLLQICVKAGRAPEWYMRLVGSATPSNPVAISSSPTPTT
jgi:hypothetical protein